MRKLLILFLLATGIKLWADNLPEWLIPLREAIYEQELSSSEIKPLYEAARAEAQAHYSGTDLDLALSRCEYFMGRAFQYEGRNSEAAAHYTEGVRLAERAVQSAASAEAWQILAENISQSCAVLSTSYALANGLKVERYAKRALALDKRNAAAQLMIAARWVYAPAPLHNHRRGIQMMEAIITEGDMEKDDRFNVYLAIGYAYIQQKKYADARPWLLKAEEIYPTNKFLAELLEKK